MNWQPQIEYEGVTWQSQMDLGELLRQFLDLKRNQEELMRRVQWLEDEIVTIAGQN